MCSNLQSSFECFGIIVWWSYNQSEPFFCKQILHSTQKPSITTSLFTPPPHKACPNELIFPGATPRQLATNCKNIVYGGEVSLASRPRDVTKLPNYQTSQSTAAQTDIFVPVKIEQWKSDIHSTRHVKITDLHSPLEFVFPSPSSCRFCAVLNSFRER